MATKAVAAAPEAISEESSKTQIADRPTEAQAVDDARHADNTTVGNAPPLAGESQKDARHISPAYPDNIGSQAELAAPIPSAPEPPAEKKLEALESNASGSLFVVPDTAVPVTLSDPDKVKDAVVPLWTKFADLTIKDDLGSVNKECVALAEGGMLATTDHNVQTPEQSYAPLRVENHGAFTAAELHNTNLENFKEGTRLLGKFSAHLYDRVLPALNESIKRLKAGEEINGFSGERQVGAYLESIGYTAELVRQWNKRHRDRMADLKKTLGLTDGNVTGKLTDEQRELRDTLLQQGYDRPEATRLAKLAEGNSAIERFNWVMGYRARQLTGASAGNSNTLPASQATEESAPTQPAGVTAVTHADTVQPVPRDAAADQLREALANEPDRDVASKMLTEHLSAYAEQFGDGRITIKEVTAKIEFVGRDHRIMPDDWLEKQNGNEAPTLCKCVGVAEFMQRRKIQEWKDGGWSKERVIFNTEEDDYRVVTQTVARRLAPQAFPKPPSSEGL